MMLRPALWLFTLVLMYLLPHTSLAQTRTFKQEQRRYSRVRTAYTEKEATVKAYLTNAGITSSYQLLIIAFKQEQQVEVWAKGRQQAQFTLVHTYEFCTTSGILGPKRREGDYQIPEGYYHIDRFNPYSSFYLSLGINYPNKSDKLLTEAARPGGDIFLHGACVTIGCIPITDQYIKEVYVMATEARNAGQQKIPFWIFPARLTSQNMAQLKQQYSQQPTLPNFWQNLQPGYTHFTTHHTLPNITINNQGQYVFN